MRSISSAAHCSAPGSHHGFCHCPSPAPRRALRRGGARGIGRLALGMEAILRVRHLFLAAPRAQTSIRRSLYLNAATCGDPVHPDTSAATFWLSAPGDRSPYDTSDSTARVTSSAIRTRLLRFRCRCSGRSIYTNEVSARRCASSRGIYTPYGRRTRSDLSGANTYCSSWTPSARCSSLRKVGPKRSTLTVAWL